MWLHVKGPLFLDHIPMTVITGLSKMMEKLALFQVLGIWDSNSGTLDSNLSFGRRLVVRH